MEKQEKQAIEILHMMCGNNGCVISDSGGKDSSVGSTVRNILSCTINVAVNCKPWNTANTNYAVLL